MSDIIDYTEDIEGKSISFLGNEKLKRIGTKLPYTKEHIDEYIKCANDWRYFAQNYYYILNIDTGYEKIKLRDYQEEIIENFINHRFNCVMTARQCVIGETLITIRNKETGEIEKISFKELEKKLLD